MDGDFQTRYVAAEQAYGAGDFEAAQTITNALLAELEPLPKSAEERDAALAWQAFVALLAGHIHLYGLQQPDQAHGFYSLVLSSHPPDTLRQLAEQGLERLTEQNSTPTVSTAQPEPEPAQASLISDPFLVASSESTQAAIPQAQTTATPWLDLTPEPVTQPEAVVEVETLSEQTGLKASTAVSAEEVVDEKETTMEEKPIAEEAFADAAADVPDTNSSPPVPEGLLQRLEAGRLRVDL